MMINRNKYSLNRARCLTALAAMTYAHYNIGTNMEEGSNYA